MPSDWTRLLKKRSRLGLLTTLCSLVLTVSLFAQVSPEEHAKHHPNQGQAGGPPQGQGNGPGGMGGKPGPPEGVGGGPPEGMGGMMGGGMMEKMGAPKPKDMYPKLMSLPDLPMEQRAEIKLEAHQRMVNGTILLSQGLDELTDSASTDDFDAMQQATAKMREGLAQFESGLAAHRAIAEGKHRAMLPCSGLNGK